jgi:hypothetical protein
MATVKDFSGYEITEEGEVLSLVYPTSNGRRFRKKPYVKKYWLNKDGYKMVTLRNDEGKKVHKSVHRLVAEAFLPNCDGLPVVCHKDSNPRNNHVSNLKWGSIKDNIQDEIKRGTFRGYNKLITGAAFFALK